MGPDSNGEMQWKYRNERLTDLEKRMVIGEIVRLEIETMFDTYMYSFGGRAAVQFDCITRVHWHMSSCHDGMSSGNDA